MVCCGIDNTFSFQISNSLWRFNSSNGFGKVLVLFSFNANSSISCSICCSVTVSLLTKTFEFNSDLI